MHSAKIIADSVSVAGVRLTTLEVVMPRIILAEFNTHRMFSRNSASSRAIPIEKMLKAVNETPYIPSVWGSNQKGMQAGDAVSETVAASSEREWLRARDAAVEHAENLFEFGIHKQLVNRLLEPFMWHTVLVSATEWSNFFHRRDHPAAHPDMQIVARMMREAMTASVPNVVHEGEWHLPFGTDSSGALPLCVSTARCARVSYLTHDKERPGEEDTRLHNMLLEQGHMSPFEHPARPATHEDLVRATGAFIEADPSKMFYGNFRGWVQYRKLIPYEADIPV
jgi:thymidylate synthase ThyX